MSQHIVSMVKQAGVVGAGGAGFPTYVKLQANVDTYIVNAAECEPLLCKDRELARTQAGRLIDGLRIGMLATGATRGIIAIKAKNKQVIEVLSAAKPGDVDFCLLDDFYPSGDEFVTVYEATGRLIPPGGLPLAVGVVVNNVETLYNVSRALESLPVTHSYLTVGGAVREPCTVSVPIGTSLAEVLQLSGGPSVEDTVAIENGLMMGRVVEDLRTPVTKTTAGLIILPADHGLARRMIFREEAKRRICHSGCDQCYQCTELCPRYLLGYGIEPHKVMRSNLFEGERMEQWARLGLLCCECGLCELYACPEDLWPRYMCVRSKRALSQKRPELPGGLGYVHPMRSSRRVPLKRLMQRLGVTEWNVYAPFKDVAFSPSQVKLKLRQHIGKPATPVVRKGETVQTGQPVAEVSEEDLGTNIHATIDGKVVRVEDDQIVIESGV